MNNKIGLVIITLLLINILAIAIGFSYLQQEINHQNEQTQNPISTPPGITPIPTQGTSLGQQTSTPLPYKYTVYEWYLKPQFINNITWLNQTSSDLFSDSYNLSKTWTENYIDFIKDSWVVPQSAVDNDVSGLVGAYLIFYLPVNVTLNEVTGFTKASYQYAESTHYVIESILPNLSVSKGWTKNLT